MTPPLATKLLAMMAFAPAAINPAPAAGASGIAVALCGSGAGSSTVTIPLHQQRLPGKDNGHCCDKACHAGGTRKRLGPQIDAQD